MGDIPPALPASWRVPLSEVDRYEGGDPTQIGLFLQTHGLDHAGGARPGHDVGVALLLGASACARLAGLPEGPSGPAGVPDVVAVAYRRAIRSAPASPPALGAATVGEWRTTWSDAEHAGAVAAVRAAIGRGDVYQANVVGHRSAPAAGDSRALARAVGRLRGATYGGTLSGQGWAVGSASPEQLVRVVGDRITTVPVKGTSRDPAALLASGKDRAEHIMIVDLARNDLARVSRTGSVEVEQLYELSEWSGLWHAGSRVAGRLRPDLTTMDVLAALAPGGSVTGAPKRAACSLLAGLEPVGRGPAMGAFGFVWPGGLDLGLSIRTVAVADGRVHLWAGGGITWGSDPWEEVAEAHAKAEPVLRALAQCGPRP